METSVFVLTNPSRYKSPDLSGLLLISISTQCRGHRITIGIRCSKGFAPTNNEWMSWSSGIVTIMLHSNPLTEN